MDAKSKADFIKSMASGSQICCQRCNAINESDAKFCISCGNPLELEEEKNDIPFAPVKKEAKIKKEAVAKEPMKPENTTKEIERYEEPKSVFAEGLPAWDIEPPIVTVRRRNR